MILTKDNLLRFVREKKFVTPTIIAENFDTNTMIASAALSGLSKDKLISITNLKIGSTPYYYDRVQPECLIELGEKHFSRNDKEFFLKLKESEVLNENSLSVQEKLSAGIIKDFAKPLDIEFNSNKLKFWVWYLRDLNETKAQILLVLNPKKKAPVLKRVETGKKKQENSVNYLNKNSSNNINNNLGISQGDNIYKNNLNSFKPQIQIEDNFENLVDNFIKNYFKENYLKIIEKEEKKLGTFYKTQININKIEIIINCFYFDKKPKDSQIISFFTSTQTPKIIFIKNAPKKYFKLAENIENLIIVNI